VTALQVDRVPEHDGGHHEVQPTCAMPLVLVRAIPRSSPSRLKNTAFARTFLAFALIQPDVDAAAAVRRC
jgi:hypothetical protein